MSDKTTHIEVVCTQCSKKYKKTLHRHKEATKYGYKPFCGKSCSNKYFSKIKNTICKQCGKKIIKKNSQYKKTTNHFCNTSCSAKFNNANRVLSEDAKQNIRNGVIKYHKELNGIVKTTVKHCLCCGKIFKSYKSKCCSRQCGQIYKFGILPYTKDEVVNKIIEIFTDTNRTPQIRDCERRLTFAAVKFFGTWNKAMKDCGLIPNKSKYQKTRLKCLDGHMADSISERIIDDWLFNNEIEHDRFKKYPNSNMNCDFYLIKNDLWVEYFGLHGSGMEEYENSIEVKHNIAKKYNLTLLSITPMNLYKNNKFEDNNLVTIFESII